MNNDASNPSISRRKLLVLASTTGVVAACGGGTIMSADGASEGGDNDAANPADGGSDDAASTDSAPVCTADPNNMVGMVSDFAVGTWTVIDGFNCIVSQDASGLYAFSNLCTHEACAVNPPSRTGQTYCACHGSRFDGNGNVLAGPARRPLPHFAMAVCDGAVYVDTTMRVAATTRTGPTG